MYFSNDYYAHILDKFKYYFKPGDVIAGTILTQEKTGYLVNIGGQCAAYLPNKEINPYNNGEHSLSKQTTCEFFILIKNNNSSQYIVSLKRIRYIKAWQRIKQLYHENIIMYTHITGTNKGGFLVKIENIQGFIPKSHIGCIKYNKQLHNFYIACKFLLVNEYKNQLILSNKCALLEKTIKILKVGNIIEAPIVEIKSYGVFVNVHNLPALLHTSEINNKKINNLNKLFAIGETIQVKIIHINTKQGKILVSQLNLI